ncbi:MAG: hypothetical protein U0670_08485 [Anaerolineae bacterium]
MLNRFSRRLISAALALAIPLLSVVYLLAQPSQPVMACNPCNCPQDSRINCQGIDEYAVYTRTNSSGVCYIDVYLINGNDFHRAFRATSAEIAAVGDTPEVNTEIDSYYEVALYRLTTGEFQVNYGPSRQDGKIYVVTWTGCPATAERAEHSYVPGE